MQFYKRHIGLLSALGLTVALGACGDDKDDPETRVDAEVTPDSETTPDAETVEETTPDAETVEETTPDAETVEETTPDAETVETNFATLTFSIDDSANRTFEASDELQWKGSFNYDAATNVVAFDAAWGGPFPLLYDDGPAPAGHEKPGATAGDSIWTTVVKVASPAADQAFEYGAAYGAGGASWIWVGTNGSLTVPAGSTAQIDAPGLVIAPHGTVDLLLTIDVGDDGAALDPLFQGLAYTDVKVKGSAWGWVEVAMTDDGTKGDATAADGIYTFRLSDNLGKHDGLLKPGVPAEFVFVLGGVEYKVEGAPPATGVTAWLVSGDDTVEADIGNLESNGNTYVEVPALVELRFAIDDSANKTYDVDDVLQWKGSFNYSAETNTITFDGAWGGPFVNLYDDGPAPGHEPAGATAGDSIWSASVWVANEAREFEYGAQRVGDQWIWVGTNGKFSVAAGQLGHIDVPGLTIAPFGEVDFRLEIDVSADGANLNALFQGLDYTGKVRVKGSAWGWSEVDLTDDGTKGDTTSGDGVYTFVLSENTTEHSGLLEVGAEPEFIFVLDGVEYKNTDGEGAQEGVTAYSDYGGAGADACVAVVAACVEEEIGLAANKNTIITVGAD